jgi:hypothetical protein
MQILTKFAVHGKQVEEKSIYQPMGHYQRTKKLNIIIKRRNIKA